MKFKKRLKQFKRSIITSWYIHYYYNATISPGLVLVDSKNGIDLGSNMLRIILELKTGEYPDLKIYLSYQKKKKEYISKILETYNLSHKVNMIRESSFKYYKVLSKAKFLFTDTSFPRLFIKKEGQIYANTWHGTPLKKMGKDVANRAYAMGNIQRNLLMADYLVYPNEYMKRKMLSACGLTNLYQGKILCEGYPRNTVFFDTSHSVNLKQKLGLNNKKIYSYMPTWRGVMTNRKSSQQKDQLEYYFLYLDKHLNDDEIFYVRLHPFVANTIDYTNYKHVKPFPEGYEPYDIINISDCLVTDYSSVFFDYANSGKKIIMFIYDKEVYLDERGLYIPLSDLPFPQVRSIDALIRELRSEINYNIGCFLSEYCTYDNINATKNLCRHIVLGQKICKEETATVNTKDKVLIYSGSLAKNGLTSSLLNLFENIDLDKRNYYVTFRQASLKAAPTRVTQLPDNVDIIPMSCGPHYTIMEAFSYLLYFKKNKSFSFVRKYLDRLYSREYKKHYDSIDFKYVIHFTGYEKEIINLYKHFPGNKTIFVHSDMLSEISTRGNQHYLTLNDAYQHYDNVAVVTQDIVPATEKISGRTDNIRVVNNCHAYNLIQEKSNQAMTLDPDTSCNISSEDLTEVLNSTKTKFITIGRFSPEKGHFMLLDAFDKYYQEYPDTYLIIIGGHGVLYRQTLDYVDHLKSKHNIIIIKSISNPMPILKCCNLFLLSSVYEGLGLTMLEADSLGIPTVSTDIVGPRGFMKAHNGFLTPPTIDGLYEAMLAFSRGEVKAMNVNYEAYNKNAVAQFEALFER